MSASNPHQDRARELVDMLAANGASFDYKAAAEANPASFTYALPRGGDRWKCRGLVAEAKADPLLWRVVVAEVAHRIGRTP